MMTKKTDAKKDTRSSKKIDVKQDKKEIKPAAKAEIKKEDELSSKKKDELYKDRLGRGEGYWKNRVEEWKNFFPKPPQKSGK